MHDLWYWYEKQEGKSSYERSKNCIVRPEEGSARSWLSLKSSQSMRKKESHYQGH